MGLDQEGFTELYETLYPRVLGYALRRVPPDDAHEATDETFLIAWRRRSQVPEPALPWLLVTARNTIANQQRRRSRQDVIVLELARYACAGAGDPGPAVIEREILLTALTALTGRDREALMLTEWDGLSARDAAQVAGCSAVAFAVRLHRARKRFTDAVAGLDNRHPQLNDLAVTGPFAKDGSK